MTVPITCPNCDRLLKAPETVLGKRIRCPACAAPFVCQPGGEVPSQAPPPPVPILEEAPDEAVAADLPRPVGPRERFPVRGRPEFRPPLRKRSSAGLWIGLVVAVVVAAATAVGGVGALLFGVLHPSIPDGEWVQFTTPDGACSVSMPGVPELDNAVFKGAPGSKYLLLRKKEDVFFAVAYIDVPSQGVGPNLLTLASAAERDALSQKVNGTVASEQDLTVLGYSGREIQIRAASPHRGAIVERLFLVPNGPTTRLYMVGTGGSIIEPGTGAAAKFFDSLAIHTARPGAAAPPNRPNPPTPAPPKP